MSKDPTERKKYSRYLKSAEDNLKRSIPGRPEAEQRRFHKELTLNR
jgi:hypothetical protein